MKTGQTSWLSPCGGISSSSLNKGPAFEFCTRSYTRGSSLSLPHLLRFQRGHWDGRQASTVFSGAAAHSLTTLPDPTTLATLSRVPVPACSGRLAQTHTPALAALCTCFSNKGASISKVFFQSIAKKIELFFLSCGARPATKILNIFLGRK